MNNALKLLCTFCLALLMGSLYGKPLPLTEKEIKNPPPRIIRTCCSFGTDLKVMGIPMVKVTDISSPGRLGNHQFLGDKSEGNGIIYTERGGFIDLGHLRDQADWTAYLYSLIIYNKNQGVSQYKLGHEGGPKSLQLQLADDINNEDVILMAGKIAYDLSVWHEIATYYGTSTLPLVPERYSSFSIEDAYSNLLGVQLSMKAIHSELPYEQAMTLLISQMLDSLGAVQTVEETYDAMEAVHNLWWTRNKKLPSRNVLLERQLDVYSLSTPWLVPGWATDVEEPVILNIPMKTEEGELLTDYYQLNFKLNFKFPFRRLFPDRTKRFITQNDFELLIAEIEKDLEARELREKVYSEMRSERSKK